MDPVCGVVVIPATNEGGNRLGAGVTLPTDAYSPPRGEIVAPHQGKNVVSLGGDIDDLLIVRGGISVLKGVAQSVPWCVAFVVT
jgi:hypothetical protein